MKPAALLGLASLPLISGCVAAAIPLAAGAALVGTQTGRERSRAAVATPANLAVSARNDLLVNRSSPPAPPPPGAPMLPGQASISAFQAYSLALAGRGLERVTRTSAILSDASLLRPQRKRCGPLPAAVFIDLDPGRGSFDPLRPGRASPGLGSALADLRRNGLAVVWFSRLGFNFAAATRTALAAGGLDPAGEDEVVLLRDITDRKQTSRDEVARRLCPIAMLGDERADFDELYLYLRNSSSAAGLDAMIERGWFLSSPFAAPDVADLEQQP